jgi:hypothetical protein
MAPRYEVREVQDRGHYWQVVYDVTHDNGFATEHGHSIPKETLEWRAAEYRLDPVADFETILDLVLAEPFVSEEEQVGSVLGKELVDAPDIETARSHHISRCARAKLKHRIGTRKGVGSKTENLVEIPNPFDVIRNGFVIDPTVVAIKRAHVEHVREERAARRAEMPGDRAERIARELRIDLPQLLKREMGNRRG